MANIADILEVGYNNGRRLAEFLFSNPKDEYQKLITKGLLKPGDLPPLDDTAKPDGDWI